LLRLLLGLAAPGFAVSGPAAAPAADDGGLFAMDTIARDEPEDVAATLQRLGYTGLGGQPGDFRTPAALAARGLRFTTAYLAPELGEGGSLVTPTLRAWLAEVRAHRPVLWVALRRVRDREGRALPGDSPAAQAIALAQLRELAAVAAAHDATVSLYPHAGFWLERFAAAVHLARAAEVPVLGVTFNLCHWLKVDGAERDPEPLWRDALPLLQCVTINGADAGDTRSLGWDRLIQPLDRGTYDVRRVVTRLRELGYRGPIGFQGFGIREDRDAVLGRSIAAWRAWTADADSGG